MEIQQLTQLCVNMCQHMCQCWLIYIYLHKSPSIRYEWIYLPNLSPGQGQDCCHWSLILKQLRNGRNLTLVVDVSWKWLNYVEFYFLNRGTISCYWTPKQNLTAMAEFVSRWKLGIAVTAGNSWSGKSFFFCRFESLAGGSSLKLTPFCCYHPWSWWNSCMNPSKGQICPIHGARNGTTANGRRHDRSQNEQRWTAGTVQLYLSSPQRL
jgi:hypothetical protein